MPVPAGMEESPRQSLGRYGENLACAELQRRGYAILERRYRTRFGEIDIVCRDRGMIVFVEVKARRSSSFGGAAEAVTAQKQRRIAQMAVDFLSRRRLHDHPCRFDVVAVSFGRGGPRVDVYEGAFDIT
jgi:putative endonuclease